MKAKAILEFDRKTITTDNIKSSSIKVRKYASIFKLIHFNIYFKPSYSTFFRNIMPTMMINVNPIYIISKYIRILVEM